MSGTELTTAADVIGALRERVPDFPDDFEARLGERLKDVFAHYQLQTLIYACRLIVLTGLPARCTGVTGLEAADSTPTPAELMAATVKVYAVPLSSPATTVCVVADPVSIGICGDEPTYGVTL